MSRLAEVAEIAPHQDWMQHSFARSRTSGARHYLVRSSGWCMAWAAEILSHAYDEQRGANSRWGQDDFTYSFGEATADAWGDFLAADGDPDLGEWITEPSPSQLHPGDMLFWRAGVRSYEYYAGHVAIVVDNTGEQVIVSENSTSRGIGVHALSHYALRTVGGLKRWDVPGETWPEDITLVVLPGWERNVTAVLIDGHYMVRMIDLPGLLDGELVTEHIPEQGKAYITGGDI